MARIPNADTGRYITTQSKVSMDDHMWARVFIPAGSGLKDHWEFDFHEGAWALLAVAMVGAALCTSVNVVRAQQWDAL